MGQNATAGGPGPAEGSARVMRRPLTAGDQDEFLKLARASVSLHHPWYTMPTTREDFQAYLGRFRQPSTEGFLVCVRDGGAMAGMITIDSIIRGRFQSASLSYAAFAPAAGRGYMSEGLALILRYAFTELRLHRLEASIQPANQASLGLVRRLGVRQGECSPAPERVHGRRRAAPRGGAHPRGEARLPPGGPAPPPARPRRTQRSGGK